METDGRLHVTLTPLELGIVEHDLACWLCNQRPAVYVGNPRWVFAPCWECQRDLAQTNPDAWWPEVDDRKRRRPWQFWRRR